MCAAEISGGISGVDFMKAVVVLALAKIFPSTVQNETKTAPTIAGQKKTASETEIMLCLSRVTKKTTESSDQMRILFAVGEARENGSGKP